MNEIAIIELLKKSPTGNLCNSHHEIKALNSSIRPLIEGAKVVGRAKTVKITPGDNAAIHQAVHEANVGDVLVVDAGGNRSYGPFGDILAQCCRNKGIAGAVMDSTIRDTKDIKDMGFQVFSLGANPMATQKNDKGAVNIPVLCGNVRVNPGDYIVGDDDGVVIIPQNIIMDVVNQVKQIIANEQTIKSRMASGETTYEIFNLAE